MWFKATYTICAPKNCITKEKIVFARKFSEIYKFIKICQYNNSTYNITVSKKNARKIIQNSGILFNGIIYSCYFLIIKNYANFAFVNYKMRIFEI